MTEKERTKSNRNLRALLILWAVVSVVAAGGGAAVLILFQTRDPEATVPTWSLGQTLMFYGIINIGIMVGVIFQLRKRSH